MYLLHLQGILQVYGTKGPYDTYEVIICRRVFGMPAVVRADASASCSAGWPAARIKSEIAQTPPKAFVGK